MKPYIASSLKHGQTLLNLRKTFENVMFAARIINGASDPKSVCVVGSQQYAKRPILKYCQYTDATPAPHRWIPGTLTNQNTLRFMEPRILIVCDASADRQAIIEAYYSNIVVIALCNSNDDLSCIHLAIPVNTKSPETIGLILWALAQEVLKIRSTLPRGKQWDVIPDSFFHREVEEVRLSDDGVIASEIEDEGEEEMNAAAESNNWNRVNDWNMYNNMIPSHIA